MTAASRRRDAAGANPASDSIESRHVPSFERGTVPGSRHGDNVLVVAVMNGRYGHEASTAIGLLRAILPGLFLKITHRPASGPSWSGIQPVVAAYIYKHFLFRGRPTPFPSTFDTIARSSRQSVTRI